MFPCPQGHKFRRRNLCQEPTRSMMMPTKILISVEGALIESCADSCKVSLKANHLHHQHRGEPRYVPLQVEVNIIEARLKLCPKRGWGSKEENQPSSVCARGFILCTKYMVSVLAACCLYLSARHSYECSAMKSSVGGGISIFFN